MATKKEEWTTETALAHLQKTLVVPKDQWNDFSKFHYRNVESICAAAKKAMCAAEIKGTITFDDDVVLVGEKHYLKATITFKVVGSDPLQRSAFARIPEQKKGMDDCQILGSASSYGRKYAACAVFAIDDGSSDPDGLDNRNGNGNGNGQKRGQNGRQGKGGPPPSGGSNRPAQGQAPPKTAPTQGPQDNGQNHHETLKGLKSSIGIQVSEAAIDDLLASHTDQIAALPDGMRKNLDNHVADMRLKLQEQKAA